MQTNSVFLDLSNVECLYHSEFISASCCRIFLCLPAPKRFPGNKTEWWTVKWRQYSFRVVLHLCSATCISSEALLVSNLYSAPSQKRLWRCRLGFEHDRRLQERNPFGQPARISFISSSFTQPPTSTFSGISAKNFSRFLERIAREEKTKIAV